MDLTRRTFIGFALAIGAVCARPEAKAASQSASPSAVAQSQKASNDKDSFTAADFIADGNWHEKDLSSIVPEGAQYVMLTVNAKPTNCSATFKIGWRTGTSAYNCVSINETEMSDTFMVKLSPSRGLDYCIAQGRFTTLDVAVLAHYM